MAAREPIFAIQPSEVRGRQMGGVVCYVVGRSLGALMVIGDGGGTGCSSSGCGVSIFVVAAAVSESASDDLSDSAREDVDTWTEFGHSSFLFLSTKFSSYYFSLGLYLAP